MVSPSTSTGDQTLVRAARADWPPPLSGMSGKNEFARARARPSLKRLHDQPQPERIDPMPLKHMQRKLRELVRHCFRRHVHI